MQEEGSCSSQEEEAKVEGCFWLGMGGDIRQFTCVFSAYCGRVFGFGQIGSPVFGVLEFFSNSLSVRKSDRFTGLFSCAFEVLFEISKCLKTDSVYRFLIRFYVRFE